MHHMHEKRNFSERGSTDRKECLGNGMIVRGFTSQAVLYQVPQFPTLYQREVVHSTVISFYPSDGYRPLLRCFI